MKYSLLVSFLLLTTLTPAQSRLLILKATSKKAFINDAGYLDTNWRLSPQARPDVYTADRTRKAKWVTFHTDIDSIRVRVKPGTRFSFVVLLNGKDSCYTQIASAIPPETRSPLSLHDTIPFTLSAASAIQVRSVVNDTDTVNLHFDVGSFDFRLTKEAIAARHLEKVVKIQMGNLVWHNPEVVPTVATAVGNEGRFGWNLFEGKTVEINYTNGVLIIHSRLPKGIKGYSRSKLTFIHSFVCAKGTFVIGGKKYPGDFLMDTGSPMAIIMDSTWASKQHFPRDLKVIKTSSFRDARGLPYSTRIVLSPLLTINGFALTDVPIYMLGSQNPVRFEVNYLGNDLLKRFNILLDFKNDALYLKPNALMGGTYKDGV
jgi:hypothetical protein